MEIALKQVGQNLVITVDGQTITKVIKDKEVRDALKEKIKDYIAKPTSKKESALKKEIFPEEEKKAKKAVDKVVEKVKVKKVSEKIKDGVGKVIGSLKDKKPNLDDLESKDELTPEEVARLESLLSKHKKATPPPPPVQTYRRSGEH